jgi:hypothetical protein
MNKLKLVWVAIAALLCTPMLATAGTTITAAVSAPAPASTASLWAQYNTEKPIATAALAKLTAGSSNRADMLNAVAQYGVLSATAAALGRPDITSWDLNDAAYSEIEWFKNAGYTAQMLRLEKMPAGKDKPAALADARATLTPLFESIQASAEAYLGSAKELAPTGSAVRTAVASNQEFLDWVAKFIGQN